MKLVDKSGCLTQQPDVELDESYYPISWTFQPEQLQPPHPLCFKIITNISNLHWPGTEYKRWEGASTTDKPLHT
jgi:hypothetical protein